MWFRTAGWCVFGGCVLLPLAPEGLGNACDDDTPCPEDLLCVVETWEWDDTPSCQVPCDDDGDCQFRDAYLNTCQAAGALGYCAAVPYE